MAGASNLVLYIAAIIFPPFPVAVKRGCGFHLILNIILCCFAWIPGIFHAWYIIHSTRPRRRRVVVQETHRTHRPSSRHSHHSHHTHGHSPRHSHTYVPRSPRHSYSSVHAPPQQGYYVQPVPAGAPPAYGATVQGAYTPPVVRPKHSKY